MITTIILDYGKVLAYPASGNWFIPDNLLSSVGGLNALKLLLSKKRVNRAFRKGNEYLLANHKLFTEEEEFEQFKQFYRILFDEIKMKVNEKAIELIARKLVYDDEKVFFYDDVKDCITEFKKNYKVMILSDTWPSLKRILTNNGILPLLDGMVLSCHYGEIKKNTRLFEIAIEEYNLVPGECVFIDDSPENLANAKKTGFNPVLMDRREKTGASEYPKIKQLDEIYAIIEQLGL